MKRRFEGIRMKGRGGRGGAYFLVQIQCGIGRESWALPGLISLMRSVQ